ncbi:restriction endonuclease subunit S [bacterium endosymbiont of Bathymodiolus sp. 5 South]|jgi:type I restriction enzyme S subunit|uniref:restriction endonuclease subunit S n=1 Tax=bacterium endosymbiont of Bathymodiolus sp. 5 South TaxID=1181670 RepID=UPI0010B5784C|nr:restriction endonuclease subunit S [bacterium endosymbiont of Bathymodiolus sp. 5 South]SHN93145.1 Type I restriction-modification system, specificity subunit S [bacterium endosymbiont of Bathymodiolus sp. 5 South]
MSYKRLGDYIQLVDKRNKDLAVTNLLGVSIQKKFIPSIANITGTDMSVYRKIKKNQFAFSPVTSRNGEKITVALLKEVDEAILSPAYQVFEAKDKNRLIPEYLFIWFNRSEFDRYARFNSWGSARETFNWDDMCDVKLPIPDIEEQRKYVALYKGLLNNQKVYENSLDDLQLICDTYIEDLIKIEESKLLGEYIERTNERNTDDAIKEVRGMSTKKQFRIAQSRVDTKKLTNYRIVKTNEFAYVPTTDTWKVLAVALSNFNFPVVVSPIYVTFKSKNTNLLLPEYLFLFLTRTELDRYARFHSWGSARENFNWDDMCNIKLPIPDIKIQEAIVTIYHTLETRKRINEQLKASIKPLCPVLMRGVVKEMEKEETVT